MTKLTGISVVGMVCVSGLLDGCVDGAQGEEQRETTSRIIDGVADSGDPAVVGVLAIHGTQGALCTGEIVSPHFVLTASHCVDPRLIGFTPDEIVVVTAPDALNPPQGSVLAIAQATEHPGFDPNSGMHDIAVIQLAEATAIPPLPIAFQPLTPAAQGKTARVIGYGRTTDADPNSAGKKNQVNLVLSDLEPTTFLVSALPAAQCHGDSGGPVLLSMGGRETIIGVGWRTVSPDGSCAQGVRDTRVDIHAAWIESFLARDGVFPSALQGGLDRRR